MKGALEYLTPGSDGNYCSKYIGNCEAYVTVPENGQICSRLLCIWNSMNTLEKRTSCIERKEHQEEKTGKYKLLKEFSVFQARKLIVCTTDLDGHNKLFALLCITQEEYESVRPEDLPRYRVYEEITAVGQ